MAKKNSKSDELKAQPAENAEAPVGSAAKPALAPTPEVEAPLNGDQPAEEAKEEKKSSKKAAKSEDSEEKEESKSGEVSFETTAPVSFVVDRKEYTGTKFSFPAEVVEDRKRIVKEAYPEVGIM